MTSTKAIVLYELMDPAYDVKAIKDFIIANQRIPLIKPSSRSPGQKEEYARERKAQRILNWIPADVQRLKCRPANERPFARLKDNFGCRLVMVRGATKVMCHLMLGVLALAVDEIRRHRSSNRTYATGQIPLETSDKPSALWGFPRASRFRDSGPNGQPVESRATVPGWLINVPPVLMPQ